MRTFLGVDGGGTATEFMLIDQSGRTLAQHDEGSAYYLEIGLDALREMLARGIGATLRQAEMAPTTAPPDFAFIGLPAYGEDSRLLARLDAVAAPALAPGRYRCGNDMVCAWAGALAGRDGINIVAGTGSIAYGEFQGRQARAGGWGELFSDEGSAYWVAREGLALFSRMSDGRAVKGPLYELLRAHFGVDHDLDLCAAIYGQGPASRSNLAQLAPLVAEAARAGDDQARALFSAGARELADIVDAARSRLNVPLRSALPLSYSGGMFKLADLVLQPLRSALGESPAAYDLVAPILTPAAGAALYAARCNGTALDPSAIAELQRSHSVPGS